MGWGGGRSSKMYLLSRCFLMNGSRLSTALLPTRVKGSHSVGLGATHVCITTRSLGYLHAGTGHVQTIQHTDWYSNWTFSLFIVYKQPCLVHIHVHWYANRTFPLLIVYKQPCLVHIHAHWYANKTFITSVDSYISIPTCEPLARRPTPTCKHFVRQALGIRY
jgi:hypothetical protein